MKHRATFLIAAGFLVFTLIAAPAKAASPESKNQITILYDAFGTDPSMTKDWGFSALVEIAGKRILFDTGDDADILAANVKAKGVDLKTLDFVVLSHRHSDHMAGLNYVLSVNGSEGEFRSKKPLHRNDFLSNSLRELTGKIFQRIGNLGERTGNAQGSAHIQNAPFRLEKQTCRNDSLFVASVFSASYSDCGNRRIENSNIESDARLTNAALL
jgi:ribonuclease BN (tRNA processing enzyme)